MENNILHTAQKISDIGAFYYILAFVAVVFLTIITLVVAMFKNIISQQQKQQKLFEKFIAQAINQLPNALIMLKEEFLKEFDNFESVQKEMWTGIDAAIKGLYEAVLETHTLTIEQLKNISKVSMINTILSIQYELNNIITRNNITDNLNIILDSIDTLITYEVEKGREFLMKLSNTNSTDKFLFTLFSKTELFKKEVIKNIQEYFTESSKELIEINNALLNTSDYVKKYELLKRTCKRYIDLRLKIKYYTEQEKNKVIQLVNNIKCEGGDNDEITRTIK